jgi:hypothetical protein
MHLIFSAICCNHRDMNSMRAKMFPHLKLLGIKGSLTEGEGSVQLTSFY